MLEDGHGDWIIFIFTSLTFEKIVQNWGLMHQEGQVPKNFEIVEDKEWEKEVWSPPLKVMQDAGLL